MLALQHLFLKLKIKFDLPEKTVWHFSLQNCCFLSSWIHNTKAVVFRLTKTMYRFRRWTWLVSTRWQVSLTQSPLNSKGRSLCWRVCICITFSSTRSKRNSNLQDWHSGNSSHKNWLFPSHSTGKKWTHLYIYKHAMAIPIVGPNF